MNKRFLKVFLWIFMFFFPVFPACAADSYLMGEDALCLGNLVLTVNQLDRRSFQGGMGMKGKRETVEVQITLVNSGKIPLTIDPMTEFTLQLDNAYTPEGEPGKNALEKSFTIHPQGQSRGSLFFHIPEGEKSLNPKVIFRRGGTPVTVFCDRNLAGWLEKSATQLLDLPASLELAQFFIDAGRTTEAEKIVQSQMTRDPNHTVLLMQMATIKRLQGKPYESTEYLNEVAHKPGLSKEDSVDVAVQAFEEGSFEVARKILEPLGEQGRLDDKGLLLLARCWYFDNDMERAETLLRDLDERGISDKQLYFNLGNIADKKNDQESAIKWWEKSLKLDPKHFEALFNIGVAHFKRGDKAKAGECWKRVLSLEPDPDTRKAAEEAIKQTQGNN